MGKITGRDESPSATFRATNVKYASFKNRYWLLVPTKHGSNIPASDVSPAITLYTTIQRDTACVQGAGRRVQDMCFSYVSLTPHAGPIEWPRVQQVTIAYTAVVVAIETA